MSRLQSPATERAGRETDVRALSNARSRLVSHMLELSIAALTAIGGYVHFCLYRHGYRAIPKIGFGFLLQVVASAVVAAALVLGRHRVARVAGVSDRCAGALTGVAAALLAAGTLGALALSRTPGGLFNFRERGFLPAPQTLIALVAEAGVLVFLAAWLVAERAAGRVVAAVAEPPV